jgi:hypothetical protein
MQAASQVKGRELGTALSAWKIGMSAIFEQSGRCDHCISRFYRVVNPSR